MALTFDYVNVENHNTVMFDENDHLRGDSQNIIFATMAVGIGELSEANLIEFCTRLYVIEKLADWPAISKARVKEHIGLRTNVNFESRSKWMTRWMKYQMQDISRKVREECDTLSVAS